MTIAAISTAAAPGGIGIVRISGKQAREIADQVFQAKNGRKTKEMKGYTAAFGEAFTKDGEKIDDAVALVFSAPKSYTGEDTVELSCHGGLYVTQKLLQSVVSAGAVLAEKGEFTKRAFLNGKMDLAQAEAVMQLISANGEQAAKAAVAGNSGALSHKIADMKSRLTDMAAHLSVWADFPDDDVPQVDEKKLHEDLHIVEKALTDLLNSFDQGKMMREGVSVVIAGRTNAGKSTLMNLLSGCERSIVTHFEGTTRDVVEESVMLGGIPLKLADTAGIRETEDPVEQIGVSLSKEKIKSAQLILAVFDISRPLEESEWEWMEQLDSRHVIAILNKTDLERQANVEKIIEKFPHYVYLSAAQGNGLVDLEKILAKVLQTEDYDPLSGILYTERQRADTERALIAVREAISAYESGLTLDAVTICVEDSLTALCELTGENVSESVISEVFEQFCVGK
ncbi:tRNA uridine-5-carboxymethylaminomethyl(34) synthesis GTPase MnmE [Scatolibacter rhodanostii]|uniref:tRNA uridine-5-carboxymethylaminomethyl(34) synthesis GTPase MnmE n=1 Tax=Scatolibacter rhodanostii TaxID=2014781 RepID=UPI000C07D2C7|nr:tRNA uridine-5-carboxymethylaminomethyl(34) synthesis GTPase MnmE [Scatolibacter rhodanostii]